MKYISLSIIDLIESHSIFKISKFLPTISTDVSKSIINNDLPVDHKIEVTKSNLEVTKPHVEVTDTKPIIEVTETKSTTTNQLFRSEYVTKNNIFNTDLNDTNLYTNIALVCLGVVTIVGLIVVSDYFAHDTVQNIPVINTIADSISNIWNGSTPVSPKTDSTDLSGTATPNVVESPKYIRASNYVVDSPEAISRLSSTQSGNTITQEQLDFYYQEAQRIITPPESRSITPVTVINGN